MTVENFIEEYKKNQNCVKKHIVNQYVNYELKIDECKRIVDSSSYITVDSKKIYQKNSPAKYYLFVSRLISNYTDIELLDGAKLLEDFNNLNKNGLISVILSSIPQPEYEEWRTILSMIEDDDEINNRNLVLFLDNKFSSFGSMIDVLNSINIDEIKDVEN